jgi:hypothetical protein
LPPCSWLCLVLHCMPVSTAPLFFLPRHCARRWKHKIVLWSLINDSKLLDGACFIPYSVTWIWSNSYVCVIYRHAYMRTWVIILLSFDQWPGPRRRRSGWFFAVGALNYSAFAASWGENATYHE